MGCNYPGSDDDFRAFAQVVTDEDRPIVESQRPEELPADLAAEMHVKGADLGTFEYRKWLLDIANGKGRAGKRLRRGRRTFDQRRCDTRRSTPN